MQNYSHTDAFPGLRLLRHNIPVILFLTLALVGMGAVYWYFTPTADRLTTATVTSLEGALTAPFFKPVPARPVQQRLTQSSPPIRVGLIAGHRNFDSGAVCEDGLTEAMINSDLAEKVAARLRAAGVRVDLLDEFDDRLPGYNATALISIHADSCDYINDLATGFKISGSPVTNSTDLAVCTENAYREATQLPYHANTITLDMTNYHAFSEIAPGSPAIIIEVGFMNMDRELLTGNTDGPVTGLTQGILCFLDMQTGRN